MESLAPYMPGEVFPFFFTMAMFQRALVAAFVITIVAGVLGSFLLIRNMALIGDGISHVTFGGVAVALVMGAAFPLINAAIFAVVASIIIFELQDRGILNGDTAIAIIMTGTLAFGLVLLRLDDNIGGITPVVEGFLYGNLLFVDDQTLDFICTVGLGSLLLLLAMYKGLLASAVDPVAARVQGIPVKAIGLVFSILTALVVVSMVKILGALLVTALLVSPAATAQQVGKSFRSCVLWSQFFGMLAVGLGIYLSAEEGTGSGAMIALVAASVFGVVATTKLLIRGVFLARENLN
jgi:ABC-type Mn2+/Zn2+ transport system permease subunit